jgi:putative CocE/NonD family hydrolase
MKRKKSASRAALKISVAMIAAIASGYSVAQTTTLGTRQLTSQDNPAITSNAATSWKTYSRPEVYPGAKSLPLQFITLKSGKKLAVFVNVPTTRWGTQAAGRFPVILNQNAYRSDLSQIIGRVIPVSATLATGGFDPYLIKRGYIGVTVDVWGTGLSQGQSKLLGEEEQEAHAETVEWITKQPWFNGNLGLAGTSYLGITALQTAGQGHPAVKAVFAMVPMGDAYRGVVGTGGLLNAFFLSFWLQLTQITTVLNVPVLHPLRYNSTIREATRDHVAAVNSWYLPTIRAGMQGDVGISTDDGSFWAVRSPLEKAASIKVPTFIIGASKDIFQRDQALLYEQIKRNTQSKLVILPGTHISGIATGLFDPFDGLPSSQSMMLQWFDRYLMGINNNAEAMPNVTQIIDDDKATARYAISTDWPHPQMKPKRFYLRGSKRLDINPPAETEFAHQISEAYSPNLCYCSALG